MRIAICDAFDGGDALTGNNSPSPKRTMAGDIVNLLLYMQSLLCQVLINGVAECGVGYPVGAVGVGGHIAAGQFVGALGAGFHSV